jgi:tripartite-type tricarboxylate transporter receptor subunit TctC
MELLKQAAGVFAVHIPYRGIAPAFTDLLGGQTQAMFPGLAAALPQIRSGRVRPLVVTGQARHALLKDVLTMVEAGFKGFDALQWYGVVGPAGLPPAVLKALNDSLNSVLAGPDLRDKLAAEAVEPTPMTPETFAQFVREDIARWTQVARERKIDLDA